MNRISPYQTAAILIISRIFALALYEPAPDENTALTAVCAVMLCAAKWLLLFPAVKLLSENELFCSKLSAGIISLMTTVGAAALLTVYTDRFAVLLESVYPERFSRFGITAVFLALCGYTASMGRQAAARTGSLMLPVFIALITLIFFEMRTEMLPDRLNLYSQEKGRAVISTLKKLASGSADIFLMLTLVPVTQKPQKKAVSIYLAADALMSLCFFLMSCSVLGGFHSGTGSLWFTLSYCTHGSVIDRSGAVFLSVLTCCAAVTCSVLLIILSRSAGYFLNVRHTNMTLMISSGLLTVFLLTMAARGFSPQIISGEITLTVGLLSAAAAFLSGIYSRKREKRA